MKVLALDFPTFCFEASLALLVALLAWGNQISQPREAVKEEETEFLQKLKEYRKDLFPFLHSSYDKDTSTIKYGLNDAVQSIVRLMNAGQLDEKSVKIIDFINDLKKKKSELVSKYSNRYSLTVLLDAWFAFAGILSLFNGLKTLLVVYGFSIQYNEMYATIVIVISSVILTNLIITFSKEKKFIKITEELDELIEVK